MQVTIDIPDAIAQQVQGRWHDLPQKVLEIFAIEAYQAEVLTRGQIQQLLGLSSLYEVDGLLKHAGVYLTYDESDFEQDLETMQQLQRSDSTLD